VRDSGDCAVHLAAFFQDPGWVSTLMLEAHVVTVRDAAAEGSRGVLRPLLMRYRARGAPASAFAIPAVQVRWWVGWLVSEDTTSLYWHHLRSRSLGGSVRVQVRGQRWVD
jgi:hypothetical protein